MTHSIPRLAALAACSALVLAACGGQTAPDASQSAAADAAPLVLGLTYIPNVQFAPAYIAADDGFFTERGIDATIRHHGADEGLFTALVAGDEDVVIASGDEAVVGAASGMDLVSIGAYYRSYPGVVIVPSGSEVTELADLKGKTIGIPGEYGSNWYATLAALNEAGLSTEDVTIASIGYTQQAAIAAGQVDAVVGFTNNDLVQMERAGLNVHSIPLGSDVPLVGASIITTRAWAEANPGLAKRAVAAITAGVDAAISFPDHALEVTALRDDTLSDAATLQTAKSVLDATIPLWRGDDGAPTPVQDTGTWTKMVSFLGTIPGLLQGGVDPAAVVTNDYAGGE